MEEEFRDFAFIIVNFTKFIFKKCSISNKYTFRQLPWTAYLSVMIIINNIREKMRLGFIRNQLICGKAAVNSGFYSEPKMFTFETQTFIYS